MTGWLLAIAIGYCWWRIDVYRAARARMRPRQPLGRIGE